MYLWEPVLNKLSAVGSRWLDPLYPIWLERYEQADLPGGRLCKAASQELHDGEGDDPDGDECREEDPVELVEESQIGSSLGNKAPLSEADQENSENKSTKVVFDFEEPPEEEVEEQGVEVDAADDHPCKLGELAVQLGILGVPKTMLSYIWARIRSRLMIGKGVRPPVGDCEDEEETGQGPNQASHRTAEREAAADEVLDSVESLKLQIKSI